MPGSGSVMHTFSPSQKAPLWLLVLVTIAGTTAMHIFTPALLDAGRHLDASTAQMQQTITVYIFGLAIGQLIYGPLSDSLGRRPMLLIGLSIYTLASILAALAPNASVLIGARLMQALGGCAGLALGRAIARDTSTCVLCALTGKPVEEFTGRGGGLTDESFQHKKEVLEAVLKERKPDGNDVIGVLAKVGGFDIAAMCGAFLGAAYYRMPVVIDGYISAVAALCAVRLAPLSKEYMFPSHASEEPGYMLAMKEMGLSPWLMLGMRLGEGSGCVVAFQVMEAALSMMNGMALFGEEAKINDSYLDEIRAAE